MNLRENTALELRQLRYFIALAEHGSISAAANALSMAQPSLSENIAKIEKCLNVKLAIRGVRGIQLTEAGVELARRGQEIIGSMNSLVDELRQLDSQPKGPVSVGLPPSLSILLSVPLLETVYADYPLIRLHIAEAMSGDILDWIAAGRIEIGCVYEAVDSVPFSFEPILHEELFLVTAPDNWPHAIGPDGIAVDPIDAPRLQELPLVLTSTTHGARKLQEKFARSIGIKLNVVSEIDSLPHIVEMVSRASAYSILSHGALISQVASGALAMVRIEPALRRTAYFVRRRARPISRASTVVEANIRTIVREMVHRYALQASLPCENPEQASEH